MPDYQETQVAGTKWQRCNQVVLNNPYSGTPTIEMKEETIATFDGNIFSQTKSGLAFNFDPSGVIALRNPQTGELTGDTTSQGAVYVAIYSLYVQAAMERDVAQLAAEQEADPVP